MIDFVGNRKKYFILSIAIVVITLAVAIIFGVKLDVQFKGGTIATYTYEGTVDKSEFQSTVESTVGFSVSIQEATDNITQKASYTVTLPESQNVDSERLQAVLSALQEKFPEANIETASVSNVDPTIGKEFFTKSIVAVIFTSLIMILFIGIRFRIISGWSAGVTAVVALLHDVFVVFAVFVIFRIPLNDNFIAVVLTILGYSLNDTIVIYDRIRENKRLNNKQPLADLVNLSINQSFKRSVYTTISTVMAMVVVTIVALIFKVDTIISFLSSNRNALIFISQLPFLKYRLSWMDRLLLQQ